MDSRSISTQPTRRPGRGRQAARTGFLPIDTNWFDRRLHQHLSVRRARAVLDALPRSSRSRSSVCHVLARRARGPHRLARLTHREDRDHEGTGARREARSCRCAISRSSGRRRSARATCASSCTPSASAAPTCTTTPTAASGRSMVKAPMILGHEASGHRHRGRRRGHDAEGRRPGLHGAGHPRPQQPRHAARHVQCRSGRPLLGDAAGPWRPAADRRPPRRSSPSSCPTMSPSPRRRWSSRWPSACTPPPRRRSSPATSRW